MALQLNSDGSVPREEWSKLTVRSQIAMAVIFWVKGNDVPLRKMLPGYLDPGGHFRQKTKIYFQRKPGVLEEEVTLDDYRVLWYDKNTNAWRPTELREFAQLRVKELQRYYDEYMLVVQIMNDGVKSSTSRGHLG